MGRTAEETWGGGAKEPSQPEQRGLGDASAAPIPDAGSSLRKGAVNGAVSPPPQAHTQGSALRWSP